jgi:hypothetical protein
MLVLLPRLLACWVLLLLPHHVLQPQQAQLQA